MDVEYSNERVKQQPEGSGGKTNVTIKITIGFSVIIGAIYLFCRLVFPNSAVTEWMEQVRLYVTETENKTDDELATEIPSNVVSVVREKTKAPRIEETKPVLEPEYSFVTTEDVNFRYGSSKASGILDEIPAGTVLELIDEITHNGYYYTYYGGQKGYVWSDCVRLVVAQTGF